MKAVLRLEGLCCANCAARIESHVQRLPEVTDASLSFMTGRLSISADEDDMDAIVEEATRIAERTEPGVKVCRVR